MNKDTLVVLIFFLGHGDGSAQGGGSKSKMRSSSDGISRRRLAFLTVVFLMEKTFFPVLYLNNEIF